MDLRKLAALDALRTGMGNMAARSFALAAPWSNIPASQPMPSMVEAELQQRAVKEREQQQAARATLLGGYDPQTGITWNQGRGLLGQSGPSLLGQAYPEQVGQAMSRAMVGQLFPTPLKPTGAQNDALALGLQPGTPEYEAYIRERTLKPGVTVNVGSELPKPPSGFYYPPGTTPDAPELKPIPGGPGGKELKERLDMVGKMQDSLDRYRGLLEQSGAEVMPGQARLDLQSAYTDLLLEAKELANLGVLTGPDLMLMQRQIMDPTTVGAKLTETLSGRDALLGQLDLVQQKLDAAKSRANELYGTGAAQEQQQGRKASNFPEGTTATNKQGQKMVVRDGKWVPAP